MRTTRHFVVFAGLPPVLLIGCAASSATGKCVTALVLSPGSATADHSATAPANSVQYSVGAQILSGSGCAVPQVVYLPTLTTSDPLDVSVATPGKATCTGATSGPVTLTDTRSGSTAQLTCK